MGAAAAVAQEEPGREAVAAELFRHDDASVKWLRAQMMVPRCRSLLQHIREWDSHLHQSAMRKRVAAQGIKVYRKSQASRELLLEAARKHFREAISQEKRPTCYLRLCQVSSATVCAFGCRR